MSSLSQVLKIRSGEGRMAALLIGVMLVTNAGGAVGSPGVWALFFSRFGVEFLPYMFIGLGAVTLLTSLGITVLLGRVARARLYLILPLALAAVLGVERVLVSLDLSWIYPTMWLGMNLTWSLQALLIWGLAGTVCDTRQARRLFPLIAAGGVLGVTAGGLATRPLVSWLHTENLLLVWAGGLIAAFFLARALIGGATAARAATRATSTRWRAGRLTDEMQIGYQFVRRSPLMRWLSMAVLLFATLFFSLAFPFSQAAAAQFPDEDSLSGFLGIFQGLNSGIAFLLSLFLANRLFGRVGIMSTILVHTLIYLAGFGVLVLYDAFPVLVAFRLIQMAWQEGVSVTAYQAAFNVVPPSRRDSTRAFLDGVPGQAGTVLAGLFLLLGQQALEPRQVYLIGAGVAGLAAYFVWRAGRAYSGALVAALRAGQPQLFFGEEEPFGGFQRDGAAVAAIIAGISDQDPALRRVSAEILGSLSVPEAASALVKGLKDPDEQVRAASLHSLARARAASALLEVAACLKDAEAEVRREALEALGRLAGHPRGLLTHVRPMLVDPDPAVRSRAAVAVLSVQPDPEASETLRSMASRGDPEARVQALQALAALPDSTRGEFRTLALSILNDTSPAVRSTAARAVARLEGSNALEPLVRLLGDEDGSVRRAAAGAIGQIGALALEGTLAALADPALEAGALLALQDLPAHRASRPIRSYAEKRAATALHYQDLARGIESLPSKSGLPGSAPSGDRGGSRSPSGAADRRPQLAMTHAARLTLLADSLADKARQQGAYALRAIGLLGDWKSISLAIENLESRDRAQRANALETLESIGDRQFIRNVLRVWEEAESFPPLPADWLPRLISDPDAWLRACAVLVAGAPDQPQVRRALAQVAASDPDALVRETAALALESEVSHPLRLRASFDRGAESSKSDMFVKEAAMKTLPTLSVMERILFLRRVPLFAGLAPADLKQVAAIAGEHFFLDGEIIARQGEPGDEMYIIVAGEVRVMTGDGRGPSSELARRKLGEYVGEMAIISQEERMASLVAVGDVRVLCIDQMQFEGLLRERPETGLAVMRVLCKRLREK